MPPISQQKKDKISEQILYYLFSVSPESQFTNKIAQEIARDEEFTKTILQELKLKSLIVEVNKNSKGLQYQRRQRWRISTKAHEVYSKHQ
jgi:predicted transcriptional regulator with HTH domain